MRAGRLDEAVVPHRDEAVILGRQRQMEQRQAGAKCNEPERSAVDLGRVRMLSSFGDNDARPIGM